MILKTKCYIRPNDSGTEHLKELGINIENEDWIETPCVIILEKINCFYEVGKNECMVYFDDTTSINVLCSFKELEDCFKQLNK
jgi:hypothetical protein